MPNVAYEYLQVHEQYRYREIVAKIKELQEEKQRLTWRGHDRRKRAKSCGNQ
jgi:hypothetical protein